MQFLTAISIGLAALPSLVAADYHYNNLPAKTDSKHGQVGYNDCVKRYGSHSDKAHCQTVVINSVQDFCLWAPIKTDVIGNQEARTIAYCTKKGHGSRLIPHKAIKGAHFLKTPSFVQVTGQGDLTQINIKKGDEGGELDPHGATGAGNPVGGLVFTKAFGGKYQQIHEWNNFMSSTEFCFRACIGQYAAQWCPHIYDVMGCYWNQPASYSSGIWEDCKGTEGEWPGVYHGSTWYQGQNPTPRAQTAGKSSLCTKYASIGGKRLNHTHKNKKGNRVSAAEPTGDAIHHLVEEVTDDLL